MVIVLTGCGDEPKESVSESVANASVEGSEVVIDETKINEINEIVCSLTTYEKCKVTVSEYGLVKVNGLFDSQIYEDSILELSSAILKNLSYYDDISHVMLDFEHLTLDKNGNEDTEILSFLSIPKEDIDEINFESFDYNNLPDIAEDYSFYKF